MAADAHIGVIEVVSWLLCEVGDAVRLERFVQAAGVVGLDEMAGTPQLTASFTSAPILASSAAVNFVSA
jgi:hypothetical protein